MKHYWINVEKSENRRKYMEEQFTKTGLENERVNAYTPQDLEAVINNYYEIPNKKKYGDDELACVASHLKAIMEGLKSGDEYFAVLEDDTYLPFDIDYDSMISSFPEDIDIAQLCVSNSGCCYQLYDFYNKSGQFYFRWNYIIPCTGFYIVTKKGAEKLMNMFYDSSISKYDFKKAECDLYSDVLIYQNTNTYCSAIPYSYTAIEMGSILHDYNLKELNDHTENIKKLLNHAIDSKRVPNIKGIRGVV